MRATVGVNDGIAIVGLPWLVAMKLDASRGIDQGDLTRMLGFADAQQLRDTRRVIAELLPELVDVLESYIQIGRLELGHDAPGQESP